MVALVLTAVVLGAVLAWFGVVQARHHGRMAPGVSAAGVDLGALTPAQATRKLQDVLLRAGAEEAYLQGARGAITLPLARLGIHADVAATVRTALREASVDVFGLRLWTGGHGAAVPVATRVRPQIYLQGLTVVRDLVDTPAQDASLRLVDGEAVVVPAVDGVAVDEIRLERQLLSALAAGRQYRGRIPTRQVQPDVSTADAEALRLEVRQCLRAPLVLQYKERRVRLQPEVLATMITVNKGEDADVSAFTFDTQRSRELVRRLFGKNERPPVEATVEVRGGAVSITESREGVALDMDRLLEDMDMAARSSGARTVRVRLRTVEPAISSDDLREMGLSALGSEYTTYYSPQNKARARNIALAARLVDGTIVRPGKVFSLNQTLGPRTENRGFDRAPVIVDGVLRQGVGGGICQYGTTLFNAVFFAGLPVLERHTHTFAIDHYPLGRDAAVAWGSADLKFRNTTDKPVMVRSFTGKGSLTVVIVGATRREVSYSTSPRRDVRRPAHTQADPRVIYDASLAGGVVKWEMGGSGYTVTVTRTVRANGRVLFRDRFVSRYEPRDWVKRVGTRG